METILPASPAFGLQRNIGIRHLRGKRLRMKRPVPLHETYAGIIPYRREDCESKIR